MRKELQMIGMHNRVPAFVVLTIFESRKEGKHKICFDLHLKINPSSCDLDMMTDSTESALTFSSKQRKIEDPVDALNIN
ncbi:hypothetical protein TNCV_4564871 [Trichonephila clavipes]|nr:hypothetical protein TNCV_4564871 [Trichonephila clavipes]